MAWPTASAEFTPPEPITVVTDYNYPPYLFPAANGQLQGIVKDKWELWSRKTGVPVRIIGMTWAEAQRSVRDGAYDVIETISYNTARTAFYEFSPPYAPMSAHVYMHESISGINSVDSMRGFAIGAKDGSACATWLAERGINTLIAFATSEALVRAAGEGEVRLFCMDSLSAQYYLYKFNLDGEFRASPALYSTQFHWAVKKGRTALRDFIQRGFDRFTPQELESIQATWIGHPLRLPVATRFIYPLVVGVAVVLLGGILLLSWNRSLRARVARRTAELNDALRSLRQAVSAGNVGLFDWDLHTDRVSYSTEWKRQIGYTDHEISDDIEEWRKRIHPEDRERVLETTRSYVERPWPDYQLEFRFRHRDGSYRWILARAALEYDAAGKPSRMVGSHIDITDRRHAEESRRLAEERLRTVVSSAPIVLFAIDKDGTITLSDGSALKGIAQQPDRLVGRSIFDVYRDAPEVLENVRRALRGEEFNATVPVQGGPGSGSVFDTQFMPVRDQTGEVVGIAGVATDVTNRKRTEDALRERERALGTLISNLPGFVYRCRIDNDWTPDFISDGVLGLTGYPPEDFVSHKVSYGTLMHPDDRQAVWDEVQAALHAQRPFQLNYRLRTAAGEERYVWERGQGIFSATGEPQYLEGFITDVTERQRAEEKIRRLNRVYAMLSGINALIVRVRDRDQLFRQACRLAVETGRFRYVWICLLDADADRLVPVAYEGVDDQYIALSSAALRGDAGDKTGMIWRSIISKQAVCSNDLEHDEQKILLREEMIARGIRSIAAFPLVVAGEVAGAMVLHATETGVFDAAEMDLLRELAGDIAFALDNIKKSERIDYLAYYDSITGLANRSLFHERLTQFVESAARDRHKVALCLLDLDHFKSINDTLGRQTGDALLVQFAQRLAQCAGGTGQAARLGGDSFAAVFPQVRDETEAMRLLEDKVQQCISQPFLLNGTELRVSVKAGIALYPDGGADADALFRNAEAALKLAKARSEKYMFYTPRMAEQVAGRLALETKLRRALEREEFVLYYQPKVETVSRRTIGVEALLRWVDTESGLVLPGKFISLLEESGLILDVGKWVIQRAVQDQRYWAAQGVPPPRVAVNVSALQLRQRDFLDLVAAAAEDPVAPAAIDLEITESVIVENIEDNIQRLKELNVLGVNIAIDDFGTGYSSLSYLARLPVQQLKIDLSFTARMLSDPDVMTLVSTMISLAHSLRLSIVAEGVETEEQAELLRRLGCDALQGYLISAPLPREAVTTLLRQGLPAARSRSKR